MRILEAAQTNLLSKESLDEYWTHELDLFGMPQRNAEQAAERLARMDRRLVWSEDDLCFMPWLMTKHAVAIDVLRSMYDRSDEPLSVEARALADGIEHRASSAGFYWLAVTGIASGRFGVNDGLGAWFFTQAADFASPDDRHRYRDMRNRFPYVRAFIEQRIRGLGNTVYLKGPVN